MKKTLLAILMVLLVAAPALAVTALWDHSSTTTVVKYRIAWGTSVGVYPFSQDMQKSACVPGTDPDAGVYDCKMVINGTFINDATYNFVGYAINYKTDGSEQSSEPTPIVPFIKRPDGSIGPKPEPMQGLGIYDK